MLENFDPFSFNINFGVAAPSFSCYYDQDNKKNVLEADLPGLDSNGISIKLEGTKKIVVNGTRECHTERPYIFARPWCGDFNFEIQLNKDVNSRNLSTSYKNGVVKISIENQNDIIVSGIQSKTGNSSSSTFRKSF